MENKIEYYIYTHTRKDNGVVFYVGMGHTTEKPYRDRANNKKYSHRSKLWISVFKDCNKDIIVEKVFFSNNISECSLKEKELIKKYGRIFNNTGTLVNMTTGGDYSDAFNVVEYNVNGKVIKRWENMYVAADFYGINFKNIHAAISNKNLSNGSQWLKIEKSEIEKEIQPYVDPRQNKVLQFSLKGEFIKEFTSVKEASRKLKIDAASIINCLSNKRYSAGNFLWSYTDEIKVKSKRCIIQYDIEMNKIREFNSLEEIKKYLNLKSSTAIRNCFKGIQKQAYGFKWVDSLELGFSKNRL